jgi:glycosyltransferase involved in cell wall biosynthesis
MAYKKLSHLDCIGVSVVIVTYNGANRIMNTLDHLCRQKNIDFDWEVILIDNNSTDNTAHIALEFWKSHQKPFQFRILKELRQGQMYARHKGMFECNDRYMLYCDDDNHLNELYVKTAFEIIKQDANIAAVGGLGVIAYEEDFKPPNWMTETYERSYGTGSQGDADGDVSHLKGCLYTAGIIMDRVWLKSFYSMGFISSLKGRDGNSLVGGEDTELTLALKLIGGKLYYSSKMHFKHLMTKERINWVYLRRLWRGFGQSNYLISPFKSLPIVSEKLYSFKILFFTLARLLAFRFKWKNYKLKEGDKSLLEFEMDKGILYAIIFKNKIFRKNQELVKQLINKY